MDFAAIVLFLAIYYLRPQEWHPFFSKLHPGQIVMALAIISVFNRKNRFKFGEILRTPHDWLMAAYIGWTIFTSPTPWDTFRDIQNVIVFYIVIVQTLTSVPRINRFFGWWAVMIYTIVLLALAGEYGFDPLDSYDRTHGIMKGRLQLNLSIFNNANALGHSVVPVIPMLFFLLFWKRVAMKASILLLILPFWCIYLTQSKGAYLCGFATILVTLIFGRPKTVQIVVLTLSILFGYAALYSLPRMSTLNKARADAGIQGRLAAYTFGLECLRTHVTGIGYKMWWNDFNRYGPLRPRDEHPKPKHMGDRWVATPVVMEHYGIATHGAYNQNGAELGFVGLSLFIGILYACMRTVIIAKTANTEEERARRVLAVIVVSYAVSSWMVDFGFRTTFFMFAATASAFHRILLRPKPEPIEDQPPYLAPAYPVPILTPAMPSPVWMAETPQVSEAHSYNMPAPAAVGTALSPEDSKYDPPVIPWKRIGILDVTFIYGLTWVTVRYWAYILHNL